MSRGVLTRRLMELGTCALALLSACDDVVAESKLVRASVSTRPPLPTATVTATSNTKPPPLRDDFRCPATAPNPKSDCDWPNAVCEFGASAMPECNTVMDCQTDGTVSTWRARPMPACDTRGCPSPEALATLDGLPCDLSSPDGGTSATDELLCQGLEGVCACTTGRDAAHAHDRRWVCARALAPCPPRRPNIGQPCTTAMLCDYGGCTSKRGLRMSCTEGKWLTAPVAACP